MAAAAEQDNRVQIPDGTAAVSAEVRSFGENRSLGSSREGRAERREFPTGISQKTYGALIFITFLRVTEGSYHGKTAVASTRMPRPYFLEVIMNKKKWIVIVAAVLALAALAVCMVALYLKNRPETSSGEKEITVTVVHKDGTQKDFTYVTEEEYLGSVLLGAGLVEGEEGAYGLMISAVDGEIADWNVDQGYWALYIGEEYATTGVDQTPVQDGASYSLVYTIG